MAPPDDTSLQRLAARRTEIGSGFPVARALPTAGRRMVGAWCFLDHAGPAVFAPGQGMRVGPHPHIGLQTFTWLIEGEVLHRDSLGSEQIIRPGQVNLMTAGRGIAHSEESVGAGGGRLHAAQLWIALPDAQRQCEPAFAHHPVLPTTTAGGFRVTLLAGDALGLSAPPKVHTPLVGLDISAAAAAQATLPLDADFEHAVMCLQGRARVEGEPLEPGTLLYAPPGRTHLDLACDTDARMLVVGGVPFEEPVLVWWNFVARTPDDIALATADWNSGRRFGAVPGTSLPPLVAPDPTGLALKARPSNA